MVGALAATPVTERVRHAAGAVATRAPGVRLGKAALTLVASVAPEVLGVGGFGVVREVVDALLS